MIFMSGTNCEMFLINTFFRVQMSVSNSTYLILFTRLFWDAELYFRKEKYFLFWLYMLLYLWTLKYCLQIKIRRAFDKQRRGIQRGPHGFVFGYCWDIVFPKFLRIFSVQFIILFHSSTVYEVQRVRKNKSWWL